ncbi:MAG: DUF433 domain-containing protein [Fimbriimonas sp.]
MWRVIEPWQLAQLQRMAALDPERVETVLNTLWKSYPGLFEELAVSAVDQRDLSVDACADRIDVDAAEVERQLFAFRNTSVRPDRLVVHDGTVARLSEGQVAVWEVVREYRKLGSVERLAASFPSLTHRELAAALKYAEAHPDEVEAQIERYETALGKRRAEYPFAR